ncbi:TonB-dependent receptor [Lutimonas zeaxanthinifaciens]|uniref:TonB-dependent receptor n=1 Tax=Lutimonas zeaxanthinifaciens TaxID=3060215 RepID=UPI00265C9303|nr:TonB-dependent receptor [Lutimonas sp. YSD2104]WKK65957.1 TonB-dependent receptor [Lutimonas sp. YSD2104]
MDSRSKFVMSVLLSSFFSLNAQQSSLIQEDSTPQDVEGRAMDDFQFEVQNISGVLTSRKNLFDRTMAYEWSSNFFKRRFLENDHFNLMLNGVSLNKEDTGRPSWANLGGLNDALRQQVNYPMMNDTPYGIGGLSGSLNFLTEANKQRKGLKLSLAAASKNYRYRLMATYSSQVSKNGWAYMISASLREGEEGFREGTDYSAHSFIAAVDRSFGKNHLFNATFIYAWNKRGKSSPLTAEVYELKKARYNSYWGFLGQKKLNSREKLICEPIFQFNYQFYPKGNLKIESHFTYQFGRTASSRLDYGGGRFIDGFNVVVGGGKNPDPVYYQKLPSYHLRMNENPDLKGAYLAEKDLLKHGQIRWDEIFMENRNTLDNYSIYALYEDVSESYSWSFQNGISFLKGKNFHLENVTSFKGGKFQNFAQIKDLLGGKGFLDVDGFEKDINRSQNDLRNYNRIVKQGDKFKYNYELEHKSIETFFRAKYSMKKFDLYSSFQLEFRSYQRDGLYENGNYKGSLSFGKSIKKSFLTKAFKSGGLYKFNGRHLLSFNVNYLERPPFLNKAYSNVRISNEYVRELRPDINYGFDLSYFWRSRFFNLRIAGYRLFLKDHTKISYYFSEGISNAEIVGEGAFVQEVLRGIDMNHMGLEASLEVPLGGGWNLKGAASFGRSNYSSNPDIYLTSTAFKKPLDLGKSYLKGYISSGSPQNVYSLGFEYSSPDYWWISGSLNHFDGSYVNVAPIKRSKNFVLDSDGLLLNNLDMKKVNESLEQEQLESYMNLNVVGGKSWKIEKWYVGFFVSLNNILNTIYRTGGFEQSRVSNYTQMREELKRPKPLFGPKYWYSNGATFFTSLYLRI